HPAILARGLGRTSAVEELRMFGGMAEGSVERGVLSSDTTASSGERFRRARGATAPLVAGRADARHRLDHRPGASVHLVRGRRTGRTGSDAGGGGRPDAAGLL